MCFHMEEGDFEQNNSSNVKGGAATAHAFHLLKLATSQGCF